MNRSFIAGRSRTARALRSTMAGVALGAALVVGVATGAAAATCATGSGTNCPGAPTSVSASVTTSASGSALVTWTAPSVVGTGVTGYAITAFKGLAQISITTVGNQSSATVSGLTNGTSYTFEVAGADATGYGVASAPSNAVTPATVPGAPTSVSASASNASATVSWVAPNVDGGAPVSSYTVTSSPGGLSTTVSGTTLSASVSGLTNGTGYTFSVVATNSQGNSTASTPSPLVTPTSGTASVPDAPAAPTGTGGSSQVALNWTAPASNGGATITSYVVKAYQSNTLVNTLSVTAPSTSVTVTGLTNGDGYTFSVAAVNSVGTGPASPLSSIIDVASASQAITFTGPGSGVLYGSATLSATGGGSGNPVVFSVDVRSSANACSITTAASITTVSYTGAGTCVIDANQAGSSAYSAAPTVSQSVTIPTGTAVITAANQTAVYGTGTPANSATLSGLFSGDVASITNAVYTYAGSGYGPSTTPPLAAGTYTITPSAASLHFTSGSVSNYTLSYVNATYTITKATLTLSFASAPTGVTAGEASGTHSVSASASPNAGTVTYTSATPSICSVNSASGALTALASGTCTIDANDSGNSNYTAASQVTENITVAPATSSGTSGSSGTSSSNGPASAPAPTEIPSSDLGVPTSVSASTTSVASLTLSATGSSDVVTIPAGALPGGTTLSVYPVTNSASLVAQIPSSESYVVALAVTWETPQGTSPTATSPVTLSISDPSIVAGDIIYELTASGLSKVGIANVNGEVTVTFTSDPTFIVAHAVAATPSIQVPLTLTSRTGTLGRKLTLTISGGSGTGALSYTVVDGTAKGCSLTGANLSATSAGTCVVTVAKASDASYLAATSSPTAVRFQLPARPGVLALGYQQYVRALLKGNARALAALSTKLIAGAILIVTGYARANPVLARERATAVAVFLHRRVKVRVVLRVVTSVAANKTTILTARQ